MEVECKIRLAPAQLEAVRGRLRAVAATPGGAHEQVDLYFHHPSRDLVASDEAVRLREEPGAWELTYKGPRAPGDLKVREELNVAVGSGCQALLEALGFRPAARLAKRRERWTLPTAEVLLDHIDGLGWFIEIEASPHNADPAGELELVRSLLGLDGEPMVVESYLGMALEAGAAGVQTL